MRFSATTTAEQVFSASLFKRLRPLAEKVDSVIAGTDDASHAQKASLTAFAIRVISAALAFLSQVAMARIMGTQEYGIFVLVWVSVIIMGNLSCLGFQTAIIRFLPLYRERKDFSRIQGLLTSSRVFVLLSSSLIALCAALIVWFGSQYFNSHYIVPFIVGFFAMPMIALGDTMDGTARANGWAVRALAPTYLIRPVLLLVFMLALYAAGQPVNGVTAVLCAVAATYLTSIGQFLVVQGNVSRLYPPVTRQMELGTWIKVAFPIFLVEGFFFLLVNADVLMVGALMGPSDVAVYYATVKTLALVHFVFFAIKAGVANRFSSLIAGGDFVSLHSLARRSVRWTFWPSLAIGMIILLLGPLLLSLFGAEFREGYPLLFILIVGVIVRAMIGPAESLLNMSGNQAICAAVFGGVLSINVVFNAVLIPQYGLQGAAIATAMATMFEAVALYVLVRQRMGISMFVFSSIRRKVHE